MFFCFIIYLWDINFGSKLFYSNNQIRKLGFEIEYLLYLDQKNQVTLKEIINNYNSYNVNKITIA